MFNFSKILPKTVTNELNSPKIAVWGFVLFTVLMTWRSIIHMLFESYGFHEIANFIVLTGDPDPMPVIYRFFSLWGNAQLMFCLVCWVVIFRYKSLIPLLTHCFQIYLSNIEFLHRLTCHQNLYTKQKISHK